MRARYLLPILIGLVACAEPPKFKKARADMTELEKDSAIAESGLPGAGVVKRGLSIAGVEAKQEAMLDSVDKEN